MTFSLSAVVPWGRSYDEYCAMFALSQKDLSSRILGCGDGPAAFNAKLSQRGGQIVSVDPLYGFEAGEISKRIQTTFTEVIAKVRQNQHEFIWNTIGSPEELGQMRMAAMEQFLADYDPGKAAGRYIAACLPALPFVDHSFDLALCSHLLLLYGAQLDFDFHLSACREMLRLAPEARIFPVLELGGQPSRHLQPLMEALAPEVQASLEPVDYEFQRGGNQMLRLHR